MFWNRSVNLLVVFYQVKNHSAKQDKTVSHSFVKQNITVAIINIIAFEEKAF